jgi:nitrite reductase/ring-hydroxylating ferredoxin subunit
MTWVDVLSHTELEAERRVVVRVQGRQILLMATDRGLVACPNRCPHEGYPLSEGTLDSECRLTCNWHNWKFDLASGANLTGGDALRLFPTRTEGGRIWLDLVEPVPAERRARILAALPEALGDRDDQRLVRETARLAAAGLDPVDAVRVAVAWGQDRFRRGMTHALAGAADWLALHDEPETGPAEQLVCLGEILSHIADDSRETAAHPFEDGVESWSAAAFLAAIEGEDEAAAVRLLRGAVAAGAGPDELEPVLVRAALAHYQDFGHALIYAVKSCALIRRLGPEAALPVWLPYLRMLVHARREDLLPEFRDYAQRLRRWGTAAPEPPSLDPAELRGVSVKRAMAIAAAWASTHSAEAIFACLVEAAGWSLLHADADRFRRTDVNLADSANWLDLTHMVTFAEAGIRAAALDPALWPAVLLQLACFLGRNAGYVDADLDTASWRVDDPAAFRAAARRLLFDHGVGRFIVSVHLLKTTLAAESLARLVPAAGPVLAAAANRFLHTPIKQRHALRTARQMRDFVREE